MDLTRLGGFGEHEAVTGNPLLSESHLPNSLVELDGLLST